MKPFLLSPIAAVIMLLAVTTTLSAQNVADALRYSQQDITGTARFAAAGGAFTALGADYGSITANPAGAAMFRKNEFVISTSLRLHETKTTLAGASQSNSERLNNFRLDALGLVFSRTPRGRRWSTFNTVIGYNRTANFNRKYYYEGDAKGSIINTYADDATASGANPDNFYPFGAGLAYDANAIYLDTDGKIQSDFEGNRDAVVSHNQYVLEQGGAGELHFGFAGTYRNRLMLGLTAGLPLVNYTLSSIYEENDPNGAVEYFDRLSVNETTRSEGVGFNLKMGLIFRASQALRIGATVHTPTFLAINDSYNTTLRYEYTDGTGAQVRDATSPDGLFDYKMNTPFRTSVGAAYLIGTYGFISADAEMVDYAGAIFNLTSDVNNSENAALERELNREIAMKYRQTINLKFGGEFCINQQGAEIEDANGRSGRGRSTEGVRLRAGVQMLGNPNASGIDNRMVYSTGVGYRGEDYYLDLTYRNLQSKFAISPYDAGTNTLRASSSATNHDFMLTLGFRF